MTCREKLAMEHPENIGEQYLGGANGCPNTYGYLPKPHDCCGADDAACRYCWDREIPGTSESPETFHEKLVRTIQDVGQEIIDNAEDYVGTSPYIRDMTITVIFDSENDCGGMLNPCISVEKNYVSKRVLEHFKEEGKL